MTNSSWQIVSGTFLRRPQKQLGHPAGKIRSHPLVPVRPAGRGAWLCPGAQVVPTRSASPDQMPPRHPPIRSPSFPLNRSLHRSATFRSLQRPNRRGGETFHPPGLATRKRREGAWWSPSPPVAAVCDRRNAPPDRLPPRYSPLRFPSPPTLGGGEGQGEGRLRLFSWDVRPPIKNSGKRHPSRPDR